MKLEELFSDERFTSLDVDKKKKALDLYYDTYLAGNIDKDRYNNTVTKLADEYGVSISPGITESIGNTLSNIFSDTNTDKVKDVATKTVGLFNPLTALSEYMMMQKEGRLFSAPKMPEPTNLKKPRMLTNEEINADIATDVKKGAGKTFDAGIKLVADAYEKMPPMFKMPLEAMGMAFNAAESGMVEAGKQIGSRLGGETPSVVDSLKNIGLATIGEKDTGMQKALDIAEQSLVDAGYLNPEEQASVSEVFGREAFKQALRYLGNPTMLAEFFKRTKITDMIGQMADDIKGDKPGRGIREQLRAAKTPEQRAAIFEENIRKYVKPQEQSMEKTTMNQPKEPLSKGGEAVTKMEGGVPQYEKPMPAPQVAQPTPSQPVVASSPVQEAAVPMQSTTEGVDLEFNFMPSKIVAKGLKDVSTNSFISQLAKKYGLKKVIVDPPYTFEFSQEGGVTKNGDIRLNPNAQDPQGTFLHELGHIVWKNSDAKSQRILTGAVYNLAKKLQSEAPGYANELRNGEPEEALAEMFRYYDQIEGYPPDELIKELTPDIKKLKSFYKNQVVKSEKNVVPQQLGVIKSWEDIQGGSTGGYITPDLDIPGIIKKHGDTWLNVEDVNGGHHEMKASDFIKAIKNKVFDGYIKSVTTFGRGGYKTDDYTLQYLPDFARAMAKEVPTLVDVSPVLKRTIEDINRIKPMASIKPPQEAAAPQAMPIVMTEEEYLSSKGATFMKGAEPALDRTPGGFPKGVREKYLDKVQSEMEKNNELREILRKEYKEKVLSGEIRPPTRIESLVRTAKGDEALESVQAARRLLKKQGINWETELLSPQEAQAPTQAKEPSAGLAKPQAKPAISELKKIKLKAVEGGLNSKLVEVEATPVKLDLAPQGYNFSVYRKNKFSWRVIENSSGLMVGEGANKQEAIEIANKRVANIGLDKTRDAIDSSKKINITEVVQQSQAKPATPEPSIPEPSEWDTSGADLRSITAREVDASGVTVPKFITVKKNTIVTNTMGKETTLKSGDPYRVENLGNGKVRLIDGKQVTMYEGDLLDIDYSEDTEGNLAMGGQFHPGETEEQEPTRVKNWNVAKFPEKEALIARQLAESTNIVSPTETISHADIYKRAKGMLEGKEPRKITDLIAKGTDATLAAESVVPRIASANVVKQFGELVADPNATIQDLQIALNEMNTAGSEIQMDKKIGTEIGRALSARNIVPVPEDIKTQAMFDLQYQAINNNPNLNKADKERRLEVLKTAYDTILKKDVAPESTVNTLLKFFANNLTSSPLSHKANLLSNAVMTTLMIPEYGIASVWDMALHPFNPIKRKYFLGMPIEMVKKGLPAIFDPRKYIPIINKGQSKLYQLPSGEKTTIDKILSLLTFNYVSLKALGVEDDITKRAVGFLDFFAQAYGYAKKEAIGRALRRAESKKYVKERIADISRFTKTKSTVDIENVPDEIFDALNDAELTRTFQKDLGVMAQGFVNWINNLPTIPKLIARTRAVFLKTPINIFKEIAYRTPYGFYKGIKTGDSMYYAKATIGSLFLMWVMKKYMDGDVVGKPPRDEEEKQVFYKTKQPYSIRQDDGTYISLSRVDPWGGLFNIAVAALDAWKESKTPEADIVGRLGETALAIGNEALRRSWSWGLFELSDAMTGKSGAKGWSRMAANTIGGFVPNSGMLRFINRYLDPYVRQRDTVVESLMANIPILSQSVDPVRGIKGEAAKRTSTEKSATGFFFNAVKTNPDEVYKLFARLYDSDVLKGLDKPFSYSSYPSEVNGRKITLEEKRKFQQKFHIRLYEVVNNGLERITLNNGKELPGFRYMPDELAADTILMLARKTKDILIEELYSNKIYDRIQQGKEKIRKAENVQKWLAS